MKINSGDSLIASVAVDGCSVRNLILPPRLIAALIGKKLSTKSSRDWLLWTDCIGGLTVGALVLSVHQFLSRIEGFPAFVIIFIGTANLAYGSFSLFVTTRNPRPIGLIKALAVANIAWLIVCLGIVFWWFKSATVVGILLVLGEGIYVASLGILEWNWRGLLAIDKMKLRDND